MFGIRYVGISGVLLGLYQHGVCCEARERVPFCVGLLIYTWYYAYHHFVHLLLQVYILSFCTGCEKLRVSILLFVAFRSLRGIHLVSVFDARSFLYQSLHSGLPLSERLHLPCIYVLLNLRLPP